MPSFADIKSHALKAKDSAADKFNSTKGRYQVSSFLPPDLTFTRLYDDLTSVIRRRAVLPRTSIYPLRGQNFLRHLHGDRNLLRMVLLPRLCEAGVLMHPPIHPHPQIHRLYHLHHRNLRLRVLPLHQRGDSTPLQNQRYAPNQTQIPLIGRISRMKINKCSSAG